MINKFSRQTYVAENAFALIWVVANIMGQAFTKHDAAQGF